MAWHEEQAFHPHQCKEAPPRRNLQSITPVQPLSGIKIAPRCREGQLKKGSTIMSSPLTFTASLSPSSDSNTRSPTPNRPVASATVLAPQSPADASGPDAYRSHTTIAALPDEVLCQIFACLTFSDHTQCARVCYRWHAPMLQTRTLVAQCMKQASAWQRRLSIHWAAGYSSRIQPWLAGHKDPFVPMLLLQHQELLRHQDLLQQHRLLAQPTAPNSLQQQEARARGCLSALVLAGLHQQITQASTLRLTPSCLKVREHLVPAFAARSTGFSRCSRWLVITQPLLARPALYNLCSLYKWTQGLWQEQPLIPIPREQSEPGQETRLQGPGPARAPAQDRPFVRHHVEAFTFCGRQPDRLFTAHAGGQLLC